MGTYMSAYIEIDYGKQLLPFSDWKQVHSLTEGSFTFDKDYEVFDALAGGREDSAPPEDRDPNRAPLFAPRGMPSPCSQAVGWNYFYLITESSDLPNEHFWPAWRCVTPEMAAAWVRDRGCHEAEFLQWIACWPPEGRTWRVVSAPSQYNASWLNADEFDAALAHHGLELQKLPVEYRILRSALSLLIETHGQQRVRLIVWFS